MNPPPAPAPARLASLDAYRGFVMLLMMAEVLRLKKVAQALPDSGLWQFLAWHQSHVEWVGCSLHDLIQPSFSFLVGVALPFSLAARAARGESTARQTLHAAWRALALVLLGVFLLARLGDNASSPKPSATTPTNAKGPRVASGGEGGNQPIVRSTKTLKLDKGANVIPDLDKKLKAAEGEYLAYAQAQGEVGKAQVVAVASAPVPPAATTPPAASDEVTVQFKGGKATGIVIDGRPGD